MHRNQVSNVLLLDSIKIVYKELCTEVDANISRSLAYAVLYLTVATLIRRYDMELYDATEDELRTARDFLLSRPEKGHATVSVVIKDTLTT